MVGADSGLYVYWFHPAVYAYLQASDGTGDPVYLAPGDVTGRYAMAQRVEFPYLSCIADFIVPIHPGDLFPELPGDQYSSYEYSVFHDGHDSLPGPSAVVSGVNALCGGSPCSDRQVTHSLNLVHPDGTAIWFAFEWADSTPSAPQIACRILPGAEEGNKLGIWAGDTYQWSDLHYDLTWSYRFLTLFEVDTILTGDRRGREDAGIRPDSFRIVCCHNAGSPEVFSFMAATDTLCVPIPGHEVDSVSITAVHGDQPDDSSLTLVFAAGMVPPIAAEIVFPDDYRAAGDFEVIITNTAAEPLAVSLGYDDRIVRGSPGVVYLDAHSWSVVPFNVQVPEADTVDVVFVIQDYSHRYYPYLISAVYPPAGQTDATASNSRSESPGLRLSAYPNPCRGPLALRIHGTIDRTMLTIYNIAGQKVRRLSAPASHAIVWDGRDQDGQRVPAGVYFIRATGGGDSGIIRTVILLP